MQQKKNTITPLKNNILRQKPALKSVVLTLVKFCIFAFVYNTAAGQNETIKIRREIAFGGILLSHSVVNLRLPSTHLVCNTLDCGKTWKQNQFDKIGPKTLFKNRALVSDFTALGTLMAASLLTLSLPKEKRLEYIIVGAQNVWLTVNITQTTKLLSARNRPYTQANGFVFTKNDDHQGFFSGHSSFTAAVASTAILFALHQPSLPKWARSSALAAGVLALSTASLRVGSGKHYPTDVVSGILVGVGVALLNNKLHETF